MAAQAAKAEKKAGAADTAAYHYYAKEGTGLKRLKKSCPKCGNGFFMAQHKDRMTCGKCLYMEMVTHAPKAAK